MGRSCRRWHLGPGDKWDFPCRSGAPETRENPGRERCSGRVDARTSNPGKPEIRRECWSRGRIVSALLFDAQGGCLPSLEPPNPDAQTIAPAGRTGKAPDPGGNGSSREHIGLHEGSFTNRSRQARPPLREGLLNWPDRSMGRLRFELRTNRLKAECSTAELATRARWAPRERITQGRPPPRGGDAGRMGSPGAPADEQPSLARRLA